MRRTSLLAAAAVVLLVVGVGLLVSHVTSDSYGWFAYAPLSDSGGVIGSIVLLDARSLAGVGAAWLGSLLLAGIVGHRLSRRWR